MNNDRLTHFSVHGKLDAYPRRFVPSKPPTWEIFRKTQPRETSPQSIVLFRETSHFSTAPLPIPTRERNSVHPPLFAAALRRSALG